MDKKLLDILACPSCKSDIVVDGGTITCTSCKKGYAIKNGIPVLLVEESKN